MHPPITWVHPYRWVVGVHGVAMASFAWMEVHEDEERGLYGWL